VPLQRTPPGVTWHRALADTRGIDPHCRALRATDLACYASGVRRGFRGGRDAHCVGGRRRGGCCRSERLLRATGGWKAGGRGLARPGIAAGAAPTGPPRQERRHRSGHRDGLSPRAEGVLLGVPHPGECKAEWLRRPDGCAAVHDHGRARGRNDSLQAPLLSGEGPIVATPVLSWCLRARCYRGLGRPVRDRAALVRRCLVTSRAIRHA